MRTSIATAFLLSGVLLSQVNAIDLTPHEVATSNDGPPGKRYFFQDASKRLGFRMDDKMTASGANDSASFRFSDLQTATMKLLKSPLKPELLLDSRNAESFQTTARTFLPRDAKEVRMEEDKPGAIAINGWTSRQFIFSYTMFSIPYRRSITFLNYSEKEQIILDIGAAASDYQKAYVRGYRVLNSLSELTTESGSGPT